MGRKNLPPYVQRVVRNGRDDRFRAWATIAGKRRFGPLRATAREAHADALKMRGNQDAPEWAGTFGTRSDDWLKSIELRSTPDTVDFYRSRLRTLKRTIAESLPVDRITPEVLRQFVRDALGDYGLSPRTVQHCRRAINAFFVWLIRRGYLNNNPVAAVEWPRVTDTQPDVLTEAELADCLRRITDPWAADLATFMAYTGLRRAEVARLEVGDLDFGNGVLWVRGKARNQSHPIPALAADAAKRLAAREGFVIPGATDKARRSKIAETFRHWQKHLNEPRWHPHTLRHSVATIMLRHGVQPPVVQRFLRHKTYVMTQRYVHMVETDVRDATARLQLHRPPPSPPPKD